MKIIFSCLIVSALLVSCSSVKEITTETKTEIKSLEVPAIQKRNIPGVLYQETPIEEFFTGEVITGKVQDSTGSIIAEISYRPKKRTGGRMTDTVGSFTALIKPPPIKVITYVTTNKKIQKKLPWIFNTYIIKILFVLLILIIIYRSIRSIKI